MSEGCNSVKSKPKMEKIFEEIQHVSEISIRVRAKSQDIHDNLLGECPKTGTDQEEAPILGKLEVILDNLNQIKGTLISADGLLSSISNAVCK